MAWLLMTMLVLPVSGECCHEKETNRETKMPVFTLYVTIFFLKSFSFQLLLSLVHYHFRLYFVSVSLNISVSVSVNKIIFFSVSVSVSVNEYITDHKTSFPVHDLLKLVGLHD